MRAHPLVLASVAAVLLLGGCSGDGSDGDPATSKSHSRPADAPAPPYAATLTAGDDGSATLANTGRKADRYVVQVVPSTLGSATPAVIELKPGATAAVRYQLSTPGGTQPQLVAHSTTTGEDTVLPLG